MRGPQSYTSLQKASSLLMLLALAWLTVSLPFVYNSQQAPRSLQKEKNTAPKTDNSNPLTNTTEERAENGSNTLSEYLHDTTEAKHPVCLVVKTYVSHPSALYFVYPPELLSPPPEA